jgi:hypothetical protein
MNIGIIQIGKKDYSQEFKVIIEKLKNEGNEIKEIKLTQIDKKAKAHQQEDIDLPVKSLMKECSKCLTYTDLYFDEKLYIDTILSQNNKLIYIEDL